MRGLSWYWTSRFRQSAAQFLLGCVGLVLLTLLGILLGAKLGAAALLYLFAIVLTSLWGRLVPAILICVVAILCLTYFFAPPLNSFRLVTPTTDVVALITFATTAFVITHLVSRTRAAAEQWQAVFEHNPTMYFVLDTGGIIRSANPFGAEQLGYTVDELIGRPVLQVFPESDRAAVERNLALCLGQLGQTRRWESRKVRKNGTVIWVRETAKASLIKHRAVVLVACEDITDGKQAEEELHEAQAELAHATRVMTMGQLTTSIAHEVNQPLAAIVANASACVRWLGGDVPNLEEAREAARRIVRDGNRASEVVGRIRALATKTAPAKQRTDLNEAIQEVLALTRGEVRRHRVVLRIELAGDLPPVLCDRVQLQQVVLNLVINGIEAMSAVLDRPRELVIKTESGAAADVYVTVQDSGVGLDPKRADKMFDAFYTTKSGGMGMGLSISRTIVENHGGRFWAVPSEGRGATLQFSVPKLA